MECSICIEKKDENFKCVFCNFSSCMDCFSTYVCDSDRTQEANCMNCKKDFNYYFIEKITTPLFMKKYKDFLRNLFYEREKSLEGVNIDREAFQLKRKQIKEEKSQNDENLVFIKNQLKEYRVKYIESQENDKNAIKEVCKYLVEEKNKILKLTENLNSEIDNAHISKTLMRCPCNECHGYAKIIDDKYAKCTNCNTEFCITCREKSHDNSECNKNIIANLKEIEANARPCPVCKTNIIREYGCNHMFCTNCKTRFDWETGRKTNGGSNPHYQQYLLEMNTNVIPREPGDVPCGDLPDLKIITKILRKGNNQIEQINQYRSHDKRIKKCIEYISQKSHIPQYDFEDLRMKHVTGAITDKQFKTLVFNREISNSKKIEIIQIIEAFITLSVERIIDMYNSNMSYCSRDKFFETMNELNTIKILSGSSLNEYLSSYQNPIMKEYK